MYAGQTLVANDGYEVMLFPLTYMYMTQGEHGSPQYAMDFAYHTDPYNPSASIVAPYYAPCTVISMGCHTTSGVYDHVIWRSKYQVHTPDGLKYIAFMVGHDDNCSSTYQPVGTEVAQGGLIGYTGNKGTSTGNHVHFAMHENNGTNDYSGSSYYNSGWIHNYNNLYINDTPIIATAQTYDWKTWTEPVPTTYTVTLVPSPAGGGTVVGGGIYNAGSSVTVQAIANPDYIFRQWSNGNTNPSFTFTIQGNTNLTAYFQKRPSGDLVMINYDGTNLYIL